MGDSETPTPGSSVLVRARMITDLSAIVYPPGIKPPAVQGDHNRRYDREFLLQFATLCTAKPDALPPDIIAVVTVASPEIVHRRATLMPGAMAKQIPVPGRPGYYYPPMAARFMSQGPRFVPQASRAPQPQRQHISPGMATMPVPLIFRMRPEMFDTLTSPTAPTATTPTTVNATTTTTTTSTSTVTSSTVTPTSPTAPSLNSGASAFVPRPRKVSIKDGSGAEVDLEQLAKKGTAASPSKVVVRMETEVARVQRLAEEKVQPVEQAEKTLSVAEKQKESAVMRNVARMDIPQAQAWRLDEDAEWAQWVEELKKPLLTERTEAKENERREKKPIGTEEQDIKAALNSARPESASWNIGVDEMTRLDVARRWAEENARLEQVGAIYAVLKREAARHAEAEAEKREEEERMKKELRDVVEAAKRDIEDMRQKYDEERREAEAREAAMMELLCEGEHERVKKRLTRDEKGRTATTPNCPAGNQDEEEQVRREEDQKRCEEEQDRRKERQYIRDDEQDQRDEELNRREKETTRREKVLQRREAEQIRREKELRRREAELRRREEELARREEDLEPYVWPTPEMPS